MEVIVTKQLLKDVDKELDKTLQLKLADIIEQIRSATTLQKIPNKKTNRI